MVFFDFIAMASKGPHQPFGQLLQRRSNSLKVFPNTLTI